MKKITKKQFNIKILSVMKNINAEMTRLSLIQDNFVNIKDQNLNSEIQSLLNKANIKLRQLIERNNTGNILIE